MSIANALGLTNEQFMKMVKGNRNSYAVKYSEQVLHRKLTDDEMELVALDCEISKWLNTGNTDILKRYRIEVSQWE